MAELGYACCSSSGRATGSTHIHAGPSGLGLEISSSSSHREPASNLSSSNLGPPFAALNSLLAYLFDSFALFEYESFFYIEFDPDESPSYKPYTVDQVEQKLTVIDSSEVSKKRKIPPFVGLIPIGPNQ